MKRVTCVETLQVGMYAVHYIFPTLTQLKTVQNI